MWIHLSRLNIIFQHVDTSLKTAPKELKSNLKVLNTLYYSCLIHNRPRYLPVDLYQIPMDLT